MLPRAFVDTAILVGTNPVGQCVYSAMVSLDEYWDGEHPWDSADSVKTLQLFKLQGFLFGPEGALLQRFETTFDLETGISISGWAVHEHGTRVEH